MTKLTPEEFPYTGAYARVKPGKTKGPTAIALKRAMSRMGFLPWTQFSDVFNNVLEQALDAWDPGGANGYAEKRWEKIRSAKVPRSLPHAGELALDSVAVALVQDEANPVPTIPYVYPHPAGSGSHSGGFLHMTGGLPGNIALDFLAPGGTPLLASFDGTITKRSGHDPAEGTFNSQGNPDPHGDRFGWSLYLEREDGMFSYMTHLGSRDVVTGQKVVKAEKIGAVGHWPRDPGRSHTHEGITSPLGIRTATTIILSIAAAPRVSPV